MPDTSPVFLSFDDLWKMRIDHPYSLMVKDRGLVWSCGQCPLDGEGAVLHPGDLLKQATAVAGFIAQYLGEIGCDAASIGRLVVYYIKTQDGDAGALQALFRSRLGPDFSVLPVAIPHFYYDGMMIEVDVHGSTAAKTVRNLVDAESGIVLSAVEGAGLVWATLFAPTVPLGVDVAAAGMQRLMDMAGLTMDRLLADQWFQANEGATDLLRAAVDFGLCRDLGTVVGMTFDGVRALAELTFATGPVQVETLSVAAPALPKAQIRITFRQSSDLFHIAAADEAGQGGIVAQTAAVMEAVEAVLGAKSLNFSDIRKATTYYISGSSAEELHDNMHVRNRYYPKPGPASTGLPVLAFPQSKAQIRLQMLGVIRTGSLT